MKELVLLKNLYNKQSILYTINLYLDDKDYIIDEDEKNYILKINNIDDLDLKIIRQELTFNSLRFEIADKNKEIRAAIITQALGSINVE